MVARTILNAPLRSPSKVYLVNWDGIRTLCGQGGKQRLFGREFQECLRVASRGRLCMYNGAYLTVINGVG